MKLNSSIANYVIGVMLAMALVVASVMAGDVVKTKDGKTFDGQITTRNADYLEIIVKYGSLETRIPIMMEDVESISHDGEVIYPAGQSDEAGKRQSDVIDVKGDATGAEAEDKAETATHAAMSTSPPTTPVQNASEVKKRVYVIPLEGMVGKYFRKDKLEEAIDAAKPYDPDVIVLLINSPGGLLTEIYKLRDYLQEVRDEYHIVVWIKSAISAAAMTSFNVREMYFMKEGHIGAATAFNGATGVALTGERLDEWVKDAREMFESAGWDPKIAQAMIVKDYWLTADIEILPNGEKRVTFHDDDSGQYVLSRPEENLVIDSVQAMQFNIANAVCDNEDELAKALNLDGWVEVSDSGRKIMMNWKNTLDRADREYPKLIQRMNAAGQIADPRASLGQQAQILREIIQWGKMMPEDVFAIFYSGGARVQDFERQLKLVRAQLANLGG